MGLESIITVKSKQSNNDSDEIQVITPGKFYKKNKSYYAIYKETEISGMEGTTTTFKIEESKFSLIRIGSTSAKMEFEENTRNISMYTTPFGTMEVEVETNKLDIDISENGGKIYIDYNLCVSGQDLQKTFLMINIKA